jgi:predicted enzyme related to lactoylglutathione lyase
MRTFFKEKLRLRSVDAGGGWLIFALPAEVAIHPGEKGQVELYLVCDNVKTVVNELGKRGVKFAGGVKERGWGRLVQARLPDGTTLGIYEPKHASPIRRRTKALSRKP